MRKIPAFGQALFLACAVGILAGQSGAPAGQSAIPAATSPTTEQRPLTPEELVDSAILQERRVVELVRNFRPIVETYIQEETRDPDLGNVPKSDKYFLSRASITRDDVSTVAFVQQEEEKRENERKAGWLTKLTGTKAPIKKQREPFTADGFAQALFPDLGHFNRQNYDFEFVRWEDLGGVHCGVVDVHPKPDTDNRGFVGRMWVEDQDFNIVRFTGAFTAKEYANRAYHFDSWRLNTISILWTPAYVYTEEAVPHDASSHDLWFKAQTRVWGYDMEHAGDHREYAKPLTDTPVAVDPNRNEASQDLSPAYTVGKETYSTEDNVVERLQVAGLMAPDGDLDHILQTVVNNVMVTNDVDLPGVRCRVLLTTPLESFVMGRTIVVSRGLIDVLPDEATLAAVLSHELAHIVLGHSVGADYLAGLSLPFPDREIFEHLNFHFPPDQEEAADKKGMELFAKSPYKDQTANAALFLQVLGARSPHLPNLLHGRFSNDFGSSHLVGMQALAKSPKRLDMKRLDQIAALPLGSRVVLDPWSDRVSMLRSKPVRLESAAEKMPFEVTPLFPYLKRLAENARAQADTRP